MSGGIFYEGWRYVGKLVEKQASKTEVEETTVEAEKVETPAADEAADFLDELDEILEENAEEFVQGYVQKGGE